MLAFAPILSIAEKKILKKNIHHCLQNGSNLLQQRLPDIIICFFYSENSLEKKRSRLQFSEM
jgi:hypothetical protein